MYFCNAVCKWQHPSSQLDTMFRQVSIALLFFFELTSHRSCKVSSPVSARNGQRPRLASRRSFGNAYPSDTASEQNPRSFLRQLGIITSALHRHLRPGHRRHTLQIRHHSIDTPPYIQGVIILYKAARKNNGHFLVVQSIISVGRSAFSIGVWTLRRITTKT